MFSSSGIITMLQQQSDGIDRYLIFERPVDHRGCIRADRQIEGKKKEEAQKKMKTVIKGSKYLGKGRRGT